MGFKDYLPEFIREYLDRRKCSKIWDKAYKLDQQEKYAEAAEVYAAFALERLKLPDSTYGELSYCLYRKYAFEMWLKAKNPRKMLKEGRNVLRAYSNNDGRWLKYNSGKKIEDLISMVVQIHGAGFATEAEILSDEINEQLEKHEMPMRYSIVSAPVRENGFPTLCSQCGAGIPSVRNRNSVECLYCASVIYANT